MVSFEDRLNKRLGQNPSPMYPSGMRVAIPATPSQEEVEDWMENPNLKNPIDVGAASIARTGTGIGSAIMHPIITTRAMKTMWDKKAEERLYNPQAVLPIVQRREGDVVNPWINQAATSALDVYSFPFSSYGLSTEDVVGLTQREISPKKFIGNIPLQLYKNYPQALLDIYSLGGSKLLRGAGTVGEEAKTVTKAIDDTVSVSNAKASQFASKQNEILKPVKDLGITEEEGAEIIRNFQRGMQQPSSIAPEKVNVVRDVIKKINKNIEDELAKDGIKIDKRAEWIDRQQVQQSVDFHQATGGEIPVDFQYSIGKQNKIYHDMLNKGDRAGIEKLAKSGDETAKRYLESLEAYESGNGELISNLGVKPQYKYKGESRDIQRFGKFGESTNATQDALEIWRRYTNPESYINKAYNDMFDFDIAKQLSKGKLAGKSIIAEEGAKDVVYLDKGALENGNLLDALDNISPTKIPDSIPVKQSMVNEIKSQITNIKGGNPFGKTPWGEAWSINKGVQLGTGRYLAGNLSSALFNAVVENYANPVSFANNLFKALKTKGELGHQLGTFRDFTKALPDPKTPFLKPFAWSNRFISAPISNIDARIQNIFGEMAAHRKLDKLKVPMSQRVEALRRMDNEKLAGLINEVRAEALINDPTSIFNRSLGKMVLAGQPFARWLERAATSNAYMLKRHPILLNYGMMHYLSKIGFDNEMQIRENLGVKKDKPFVSYRYNPKSKKVEEVTAEFIPQMSTLKLLGNTAMLLSPKYKKYADLNQVLNTNMPSVFSVLNAARGVDRFGKPILRSHEGIEDATSIEGSRRYKMNSDTGEFEEINTPQGDEVTASLLNTLSVYPNFVNTTGGSVASTLLSGLSGKDIPFYKPYGNSVFGSFATGDTIPFLSSGNPLKSVDSQTLSDMLMGVYASDYYEPRDFMSKGQYRRNRGSAIRRNLREMEALENYGGEQ